MYFDEDLLLDLRLNSLNKFVKKFVITEATYTHNGSKKKLNFDINKFKKFKDKIIYIVVDKQPKDIMKLKENDTKHRIGGTVSSCIQAYLQGVQILRVHDVQEINQAFKVFRELQ